LLSQFDLEACRKRNFNFKSGYDTLTSVFSFSLFFCFHSSWVINHLSPPFAFNHEFRWCEPTYCLASPMIPPSLNSGRRKRKRGRKDKGASSDKGGSSSGVDGHGVHAPQCHRDNQQGRGARRPGAHSLIFSF
jgi:hypothetical protein